MLRRLFELIGVYKIYEKWLKNQIRNGNVPRHVGLILNGNRRWASKRHLKPWFGHKVGAEKVWDLVKWCREFNIKTLTIYAFSLDNLKRPREEVEHIYEILREELKKLKENHKDFLRNKVRIKFIGRRELIPKDIVKEIEEVEEKTRKNKDLVVNIAFAYGGKSEIVDATKEIAIRVKKGEIDVDSINEELFQKYLYTSHLEHPDVDLIVRTSGEKRLSGFLLWQSAYSELIFLDVYWPDFRKIDFMRAIRIYQRRSRRFGK